jgi:hypothetical protein
MTPRERAIQAVDAAFGYTVEYCPQPQIHRALYDTIEAAIAEHVRELLADDEATIEAMADRLGDWLQPRLRALDAARAALAVLRSKAGV